MTPTAIIAILAFFLLLAAILIWRLRRSAARAAVSKCRKAAAAAAPALSPDMAGEPAAHLLWLDSLNELNYLDPLYKSGTMIILGAPQMGISTVLQWVCCHINQEFNIARRLGIYLDTAGLKCTVELTGDLQPVEQCFPEEIYRAIIQQMLQPLLQEIHTRMGEKTYARSGLPVLETSLNDSLAGAIMDLSTAEIGHTLNQIWQIAGITQVRLCLDNITRIKIDQIPYLLDLLTRTFAQSARVDLLISGQLSHIQLITDTPQGTVGIQYGHDIFLGLDIEELLLPKSDELSLASLEGSPRGNYISKLLTGFHSGKPGEVLSHFETTAFDPPNAWKRLFHDTQGDLQLIANMLPVIKDNIQPGASPITHRQLTTILKQQAGALKGDASR